MVSAKMYLTLVCIAMLIIRFNKEQRKDPVIQKRFFYAGIVCYAVCVSSAWAYHFLGTAFIYAGEYQFILGILSPLGPYHVQVFWKPGL